jgi:hypothetical protein
MMSKKKEAIFPIGQDYCSNILLRLLFAAFQIVRGIQNFTTNGLKI